MAGFLPFALAGVSFLLIAVAQALSISSPKSFPSSLHHILAAALSLALLLAATFSAFLSPSSDHLALPLHLQILPVVSLFLLHSLASLLPAAGLLDSLLHLLALFAFSLEFLLFYLRRPHPDGLENRYFDLLLFPVAVCIFSTLFAIRSPKSPAPLLGRAAGLALHGTWFLQMGFSFFTSAMSHGCSLHQVSVGNFTIRCPAHMDAHRSAAIATLQFNCHLAFLLVLVVGLYGAFGWATGHGCASSRSGGDRLSYKPISEELQQLHNSGKFTLDSDEDEADNIVEDDVKRENDGVLAGVNGLGAH